MGDLDRRALICQGCAWAVAGMSGCVVSSGGGGGEEGTTPDTTDVFGVDTGEDDPYEDPCAVVAEPGAAGWREMSLADFPELGLVGGWVQTSVGGRTLNVAQVERGCFVAMEISCTHEGGRVDYRPESEKFVCSLHGAAFADDGSVISGPTNVPMVTYPAARDGDSVWVLV